ncbi:hypothetical protein BBJ29_006190 [Phytophthora kernoviae]|uniref:HTH CENPB-type domain-containing protein n=1 Tax=Phytophthora kernoviae TaxID=325452 RepID=A0A3F2RGR0_9STRA|nr:hypothetical protein BBJ29_006190 [Phytophthora kernoviae]RLN56468.1 hypothetical protein BBP00_00007994 [Phytophthora kernoviae]
MGRGRKPINDQGGRKQHLYKKTWTTNEFRLAVVMSYESGGIKETLTAFFPDVGGTTLETKRKSVYLWVKRKKKIASACLTVAGAARRGIRKLGLGTSLSADGEHDLMKSSKNPATGMVNTQQCHGFGERLWKDIMKLQ